MNITIRFLESIKIRKTRKYPFYDPELSYFVNYLCQIPATNKVMKTIRGIIPPITTPFDQNGELVPDALSKNLEKYLQYNLSGFLVLGSNGEAVLLNRSEKLHVLETARASIPKNRIMIAGTGCQSTRETMDMCKEAARIGADAVLVLNPFYYRGRMDNMALENHFLKVADASPVPVLIYNMPASTGIDLDAAFITGLSKHPNIIGLKDSGGNLTKMGDIIRHTDPSFTVLSGSAGTLLASLLLGAKGGIVAFANVAPQKCIDLFQWFLSGKVEDARLLQLEIIRLNTLVTRKYGVPALKSVMDMLGLYGGPPRAPLMPIEEKLRVKLESAMIESGIKPI